MPSKEEKNILDDTRYLTQFYIESRYPDDYIKFSREEAQQAFEAAQRIKDFVLQVIGKKN